MKQNRNAIRFVALHSFPAISAGALSSAVRTSMATSSRKMPRCRELELPEKGNKWPESMPNSSTHPIVFRLRRPLENKVG